MSNEHNESKPLSVTKKMAVMAGAAAAVAPTLAGAAVISMENDPVSLSAFDGQGSTANWDVDGDGNVDFQMWVRSSNFYFSNYFSSMSFSRSGVFYGIVNFASNSPYSNQLNGRGLVNQNGGAKGQALQNGLVVGPTLASGYQWGVDNVQYRNAARFDSSYRTSFNGTVSNQNSGPGNGFNDFVDGANLFGFRFESAGELHYGWAEMLIDGADVTITRWAYESDGNLGIAVGSIAPVPVPGALGLLASGAAGLLALRRRRKKESVDNA